MTKLHINWRRAAPRPVALVILPWEDKGVTIAKRDADGTLYGCRDIGFNRNRNMTSAPSFNDCLNAWISDETKQLKLEIDTETVTRLYLATSPGPQYRTWLHPDTLKKLADAAIEATDTQAA